MRLSNAPDRRPAQERRMPDMTSICDDGNLTVVNGREMGRVSSTPTFVSSQPCFEEAVAVRWNCPSSNDNDGHIPRAVVLPESTNQLETSALAVRDCGL